MQEQGRDGLGSISGPGSKPVIICRAWAMLSPWSRLAGFASFEEKAILLTDVISDGGWIERLSTGALYQEGEGKKTRLVIGEAGDMA